MRAGLLGLGAGLIVVLPAVAVLSGRLDDWLPTQKSSDRQAHAAVVARSVGQACETTTATVAMAAVASPVEQPVERAVNEKPLFLSRAQVAPVAKSEVREPLAVQVRSVSTVEAFPRQRARLGANQQMANARPENRASCSGAAMTSPKVPSPADEAAELLALGLRLMNEGDIAGARTPLSRAANLGNPDAMLALGETYDPNMLAALAARGVKSDVGTARLYYRSGGFGGLARAKLRLDALN